MNRFGNFFKPLKWCMAMVLAAVVAGCGGGGGGGGGLAPGGGGGVTQTPAGGVCSGANCVPLASAGTYVILAQAGVTNVPTSAISGDIGVSPIASPALVGFAETMDASNTFSTSSQVTGKMYAADYAAPTPDNLTTAVNDSIAAYGIAAGLAPGTTDVPVGGEIGSTTIAPGVYKWNSGVSISTDVTLNGGPTDVWVFQVGGNLSQLAGMKVILAGGALAKNIFWQVSGTTAIGAAAQFSGIIITPSSVALANGATLNGRLFTGTSVALDQNTVTRPAN